MLLNGRKRPYLVYISQIPLFARFTQINLNFFIVDASLLESDTNLKILVSYHHLRQVKGPSGYRLRCAQGQIVLFILSANNIPCQYQILTALYNFNPLVPFAVAISFLVFVIKSISSIRNPGDNCPPLLRGRLFG